jgi:hypothetical protein
MITTVELEGINRVRGVESKRAFQDAWKALFCWRFVLNKAAKVLQIIPAVDSGTVLIISRNYYAVLFRMVHRDKRRGRG